MQHIIPNLWFDNEAESAAQFYASVFPGAKVGKTTYYTDAGKEFHGHNAGDVMTVEFSINDFTFVGINGGPIFKITPAISFFVHLKTTDEVDELWDKLSDQATTLMTLDSYPFSKRYGWLTDKFGVSWQIMLTEAEVANPITLSLMFTGPMCGKAEEALQFYTSVFPDSKIVNTMHYGANQSPDKEGALAYGESTLLGQRIAAMDSARNHDFSFTAGVSLMVECDTQKEIDTYWKALSAAPEAEQCGWLQDKYGVSWQIVPKVMNKMLAEATPEQLERVTAAYMQMKKFDIATLERVYNGLSA